MKYLKKLIRLSSINAPSMPSDCDDTTTSSPSLAISRSAALRNGKEKRAEFKAVIPKNESGGRDARACGISIARSNARVHPCGIITLPTCLLNERYERHVYRTTRALHARRDARLSERGALSRSRYFLNPPAGRAYISPDDFAFCNRPPGGGNNVRSPPSFSPPRVWMLYHKPRDRGRWRSVSCGTSRSSSTSSCSTVSTDRLRRRRRREAARAFAPYARLYSVRENVRFTAIPRDRVFAGRSVYIVVDRRSIRSVCVFKRCDPRERRLICLRKSEKELSMSFGIPLFYDFRPDTYR